ncbi:DUF4249 domain-containing protein [Echinicola strongylocentroti]|uniref:DUF4249 domain-containing protein n=1 Tax=Echinicola strongylocentroti TaxID=1795355 RepID=A0A2Z4IQL3_9BACT|nr:DUF4249 family protein [Echinicola strongylocentroti]AWW33019.1 DUF4249 domain-containing protein [Echinicola strongylocentroti]
MRYTLLLGLMIVLFSCQEEVVLELRESENYPVIEASWTDNSNLNQVKISMSKTYYDSASYRPVTNAEVYIVHEERNHRIEFEYSEQTLSYLPVYNQRGLEAQHYTLHVHIKGNHYRSSGVLLEAPKLDSISYRYKEKRLLRPAGYYLTLHGKISFDENNYYRVKAVRNDTLLVSRNDYLLFDDTFGTAALEDGFEIETIPYQEGDEARIALYRLNESAYNYMEGIVELMYNDGGLFSPPPQNPPSNFELVEGDMPVLGYFLVAPVLTESVTIE